MSHFCTQGEILMAVICHLLGRFFLISPMTKIFSTTRAEMINALILMIASVLWRWTSNASKINQGIFCYTKHYWPWPHYAAKVSRHLRTMRLGLVGLLLAGRKYVCVKSPTSDIVSSSGQRYVLYCSHLDCLFNTPTISYIHITGPLWEESFFVRWASPTNGQ